MRLAAVLFIICASLFVTHTFANSVYSNIIDDTTEVVRKGSFIYASQYLNPEEVILEEIYSDSDYFETSSIVLQDSALVVNNCPSETLLSIGGERSGVINYVVQPGDVPSMVAAAFGISTNTLLWANSLSAWDYIKPGQELVILPVSGIRYTIKKGDTLEEIVEDYKGDLQTTIEFNSLPADGQVAVGQEIIIPDGQKPVYYYPQTSSYATYSSFERPYANQSHSFPWGQCTWYVAQLRYIPWSGHAKTWLYKAQQYGFATGSVPKVGAIVQTRENSYYGHVAYVEAVNGNYITVSEMHLGQGIRKVRTLHKDDWRIIGYIY